MDGRARHVNKNNDIFSPPKIASVHVITLSRRQQGFEPPWGRQVYITLGQQGPDGRLSFRPQYFLAFPFHRNTPNRFLEQLPERFSCRGHIALHPARQTSGVTLICASRPA